MSAYRDLGLSAVRAASSPRTVVCGPASWQFWPRELAVLAPREGSSGPANRQLWPRGGPELTARGAKVDGPRGQTCPLVGRAGIHAGRRCSAAISTAHQRRANGFVGRWSLYDPRNQ